MNMLKELAIRLLCVLLGASLVLLFLAVFVGLLYVALNTGCIELTNGQLVCSTVVK